MIMRRMVANGISIAAISAGISSSCVFAATLAGSDFDQAEKVHDQNRTAAVGSVASNESLESAHDASAVADIVVTGSRVARSGYVTPTPVTAITSEQLTVAAPTTISQGLNQLPQFRSSTRPEAAVSSANGAAGANLLNLRSLGPNRTLVLLDGRRIVNSTVIYAPDINTLPEALIKRVDVVTGGASATYGSDAVAGVVNFVLDDRFQGLKGVIQGGISDVGDSESGKVGLTYGTPIGSRAHLVLSGDYFERKGLGFLDIDRRKWSNRGAGLLPNVPNTATPARLLTYDNVYLSNGTFGGLITTGPLAGTAFGAPGQTTPFAFGTLRSNLFMLGGTGGIRQDFPLTADLHRGSLFGRLTYEVPDGPTLAAELSYGRADTEQRQYYNNNYGSNAFTIFADNPFIPASILARMNAAGVTSFTLGRVSADIPAAEYFNRVQVLRSALSARGSLGGWTYDAYYTHGESTTFVENSNVENYNRMFAAVDSVRDPISGQPVCRSTLLFGRNPGCVAFNPFGVGAPSETAGRYVVGDQSRRLRVKQDVGALNFSGPLFALGANDPVSLAVGAEIRRESARQTVSASALEVVDYTGVRGGAQSVAGNIGPFLIGNPKPFGGSLTVKEAYVELDMPLLSDVPFARQLTVNGSARLTDYSTSGSIWSWKAGIDYKPFDDLRLRATRSRDIRAANLVELNSGAVQNLSTVRDPVSGATVQSQNLQVGNSGLNPERADTLTAGVVYQPSWLPRFSVSVDYYNIKVDGAVTALTAQQTIDECARGNPAICANITNLGASYRILLPFLNLNALKISGVDIEASYRAPVGPGNLTLHALANYQGKYETTTPGSVPINRAGEIGTNQGVANPKWLLTGSVTYEVGNTSLFVQGRFISSGVQNVTFVEGRDIDDNSIPSVFYMDATLNHKFEVGSTKLEGFVTVNNVLNKAPPLVPITAGSGIFLTNYALYDAIGRYVTAGVRFKF